MSEENSITNTEQENAPITGVCLLIDGGGVTGLGETWTEALAAQDCATEIEYCTLQDAAKRIAQGDVVGIVLATKEFSPALQLMLRAFKTNVGAIGAFQSVICDEPSPELSAALFEFGVEIFFSVATYPAEVGAFTRNVSEMLRENTTERRTVELNRIIRTGDQTKIEQIRKVLSDEAGHDHLAAYSLGKSLEASGDFDKAAQAFKQSSTMNKMFHASSSSLGETLLVTGKLDEAKEVFEKLEKTNAKNSERKLNLATIYTEKGDFETAKAFMKAAATLAPTDPKLNEAKAHMYLKAGKIQEAFQLMDGMSEVGPFFAAKLNEMAVKLSQAGKGKSAIALYKKAHKVVRSELRYKISMNAALACYRMGEFDASLVWLERCEKEYGSAYEKLVKIRKAVQAAKNKGPEQKSSEPAA